MSTLYDKSRCIICQKCEEKLRTYAVKETVKNVFGVAKNLEEEQFFLRLNSIADVKDAIANNLFV